MSKRGGGEELTDLRGRNQVQAGGEERGSPAWERKRHVEEAPEQSGEWDAEKKAGQSFLLRAGHFVTVC